MASQAALPEGLRKETTRHPPSTRHLPPQKGDKVEVHYAAKLQKGGRPIESSREGGGPLVFKVGQGEVAEGWDLAVQTMRKGEHAKFLLAPHLAYGEAGNSELGVEPGSSVILELELLACPAREDLFEDGGAVKLELKNNPNGRAPRKTDEVQMSLKVTVQGRGVTTSQEHLVYKLGSGTLGQLTRVVDRALLSMRRGEEAVVTCRPNFALEEGPEGKADEKYAFVSIALEEIFEVYDTSVGDRDRTVLRKRIKEGLGEDKIHDGARVKVRVLSVVACSEKVVRESRELCFTVGRGEVCDALEGSLLGMRAGEEAVLRCEAAEACAGGSALQLPGGLEPPVMIQIAVDEVEKVKEKWDLSSAERLQQGRLRREVATELFKRGRIRLAAHHYEAVADLFVKLDFFREEEQQEAMELRRVANLNRAMCMLKMGNLALVKELCSAVLGEDADNPKALFRRAKAAVALKEYANAIADLERLLAVEPGSAEARQLLREARQLRKENDRRQSGTFAKMCAGLGDMPERTDRRDDDYVQMPDLREEIEKIADQHGLPLLKERAQVLPTAKRPPQQADSVAGTDNVEGTATVDP